MNKNVVKIVSLVLVGLAFGSDLRAVRLLGIFNNLTPIGKIKAPRVDIVNDPLNPTTVINVPQTVAGTIQPIDLPLPAYMNITYDTSINSGLPYTIKIEDTGKPANCLGNKSQVIVGVKDIPATGKSVCVSKAVSSLVGTSADRWQNVLLALGNNPKFAPKAARGSEAEYPFVFGLSGWSSSQPPWNRNTLSATADRTVTFAKPLRVIQGHLAFGDDSVPRFGFGSISHIYNDSPYVLLVQRSNTDRRLATTNFNEIVPPLSAVPFAMMFMPKNPVSKKDDPNFQKSAIYVYAMGAPAKAERMPPAPTAFTYITSAGTAEIGAAPVTSSDIEDYVKSLSATNPDETAELLGEETLDKLVPNNYAEYFISKYYFKIYVIAEEKHIYVERCKLGTDDCTVIKTYPFDSTKSSGDPNFFKLIVRKDENPNKTENSGITLDISPIAQEI